jgi:hypothetical protein
MTGVKSWAAAVIIAEYFIQKFGKVSIEQEEDDGR